MNPYKGHQQHPSPQPTWCHRWPAVSLYRAINTISGSGTSTSCKASMKTSPTTHTTTKWNVNVLLDDLRHDVRHFHQFASNCGTTGLLWLLWGCGGCSGCSGCSCGLLLLGWVGECVGREVEGELHTTHHGWLPKCIRCNPSLFSLSFCSLAPPDPVAFQWLVVAFCGFLLLFGARLTRRFFCLRCLSQTMFTTRAFNVLRQSPTPTTVFMLPMLLLLEFCSDRTTHDLTLGLQLLVVHSKMVLLHPRRRSKKQRSVTLLTSVAKAPVDRCACKIATNTTNQTAHMSG